MRETSEASLAGTRCRRFEVCRACRFAWPFFFLCPEWGGMLGGGQLGRGGAVDREKNWGCDGFEGGQVCQGRWRWEEGNG